MSAATIPPARQALAASRRLELAGRYAGVGLLDVYPWIVLGAMVALVGFSLHLHPAGAALRPAWASPPRPSPESAWLGCSCGN